MDNLTLEHLASYFPYRLKVTFEGDEYLHEVVGISISRPEIEIISPFNDHGGANIEDVKPILRPLSDLTKEIEHKGERFVPIIELSKLVDNGHNHINSQIHKSSNYITVLTGKCDDVENVRFQFTIEGISAIKRSGEAISFVTYDKIKRKILSWHFDILGLIDKGLAIDINTFKGGSK